jgi:acetyltransferase-like isoleucine patch superfamily enzyme
LLSRNKKSRFVAFNLANECDITFLNEIDTDRAVARLSDRKARRVYIYDFVYENMRKRCGLDDVEGLIPVKNPKLSFIKEMRSNASTMGSEYDQTPSSKRIHMRGVIHNNRIPSSTRIHKGCIIYNTNFGQRCTVYSNTTIGFPAIGLERDEEDNLYDFPHIGRVVIGNCVTIGPLCNIARGSLDNTVIEDNVRTDAHVHVAHNALVGRNTILCVAATIGGSTTIGHNCWIGMKAVVKDHISIGNHVIVGMGSTVIHDVPDYGIVAGNPARDIKYRCHLSPQKRYMMVGY